MKIGVIYLAALQYILYIFKCARQIHKWLLFFDATAWQFVAHARERALARTIWKY